MNEDTEVYLELTDDEHDDAKTAAEDTARLLIAVRDHRNSNRADDKTDDSTEVH